MFVKSCFQKPLPWWKIWQEVCPGTWQCRAEARQAEAKQLVLVAEDVALWSTEGMICMLVGTEEKTGVLSSSVVVLLLQEMFPPSDDVIQ